MTNQCFVSVRLCSPAPRCVVQAGAGAVPDPCVFYLHLNEARGDLPFCWSQPLAQPLKQTLISFLGKVTRGIVRLLQPRLSFICTWERP